MLDNLRHAFGSEQDEAGLQRLALRFYRNLGMTLMEFLVFPRLRRRDFLELVEVEGARRIQAVAREGRGGLFVTGHYGNWELLAARAAAAGFKVTAAAKTQSNPMVDRIQNDIRRRAGPWWPTRMPAARDSSSISSAGLLPSSRDLPFSPTVPGCPW